MEDPSRPGQPDKPEAPWDFKPGETISPASMPSQPTSPTPKAEAAQNSTQSPEETALSPVEPNIPIDSPNTFPGNQTQQFQYAAEEPTVAWSASEFIRHEKSSTWYAVLAVVDIVTAAIVYLLFRDLVTAVVVVVAGIGLAVYAGWKPKQQEYALSASGLNIGQRFYGYDEFRSFSIVDEGAFTSIQFAPLKRFGNPVNIYYDPKDEATILEMLGNRLPLEETKRDAVDNLMKRIRF